MSLFNESHSTALTEIRRAGNWFSFSRQFYKLGLDDSECLCIQHLINIYGLKLDEGKVTEEGWFVHTARELENMMYWKRNTQQRLLNSLKRRGLLQTRKVGLPAKREIRLEIVKIENMIVEASTHKRAQYTQPRVHCSTAGSVDIKDSSSLRSEESQLSIKERRGSKTHARVARKRVDPVGTGGFFKERGTEDSQLTKWAKRLHKVVTDNLNYQEKFYQSRWEEQFRILLNKLKGDDQLIEQVLSWYEEHTSTHPNPTRITHAKGFVYKFGQFQERATASGKIKSKSAPVIKLNERDQEEVDKYILPDLKMLNWPGHSEKNLRPAVAQSVINLRGFAKSVRKLKEHMDKQKKTKSRDTDYCYYLGIIYSEVQHTSLYLTQHFRRLHEFLSRMTEWRGDFSRYIFSLSNESVRNDLAKMATKHGGGIRDFDRLMEELDALAES